MLECLPGDWAALKVAKLALCWGGTVASETSPLCHGRASVGMPGEDEPGETLWGGGRARAAFRV